jgi:hypothetical protein
MRLEQAVFTSVKRVRLDGYQLAGHSPGLTEQHVHELTTWGPAHDSLWDTRRDARSVNFFPLTTGEFCLSWTTAAGQEYSARGGGRVYTQCFVLPREALVRFVCDPFLILRALAAAGRLVVLDDVPERLPTVPLLGRSEGPDGALMQQVLDEVGIQVFDELAEAVVTSSCVAVVTSGHVERLFQALLHAHGHEERLKISFTTGLKDSPRRPFRLYVLPNDPSLVRQSQRMRSARIIDLVGEDVRLSAALRG